MARQTIFLVQRQAADEHGINGGHITKDSGATCTVIPQYGRGTPASKPGGCSLIHGQGLFFLTAQHPTRPRSRHFNGGPWSQISLAMVGLVLVHADPRSELSTPSSNNPLHHSQAMIAESLRRFDLGVSLIPYTRNLLSEGTLQLCSGGLSRPHVAESGTTSNKPPLDPNARPLSDTRLRWWIRSLLLP